MTWTVQVRTEWEYGECVDSSYFIEVESLNSCECGAQPGPCEADNWNVKMKFSESASEVQNNENECFGESELKGPNLTSSGFKKNYRRLQCGSCNFRSRTPTIDWKGISLEILDF